MEDQWYSSLSPSEQVFIKRFVVHSGNLKKVSCEYNVSYPTIRYKLDKIIAKINAIEGISDGFISNLQSYGIEEELKPRHIHEIINLYEQEKMRGSETCD